MTATYDDGSVTYDSSAIEYEGATFTAGSGSGWGGLLLGLRRHSAGEPPPEPEPEPETPEEAARSATPTVQILVNFDGTETDISGDVLRCSITRGRSRERETMSPGRAQIDIWNESGDFDPDNISGAYHPNIRPNKPVRIVAGIDSGTTAFSIGSSSMGGGDAFGGGATYDVPLFTGRLEGSQLTYPEGGLQARVTWQVVDASKRLNRDRSTAGFGDAGELTGARVTSVLNGATPTWPDTERDIADGNKTVQFFDGEAGRYDYLNQVAASEVGAFFIGANGYAVFRDSDWAPEAAEPPLGYETGEYKFADIEITDDEQEIYNAVTVTSSSLTDQTEEDISSQAEFGRTDLSVSTLLDTHAEMDDIALSLVNAYSQPRRRISRLKVGRIAADWNWFLTKELQDRVTVRHRPVYGGLFEQLSVIQGIQVAIENSQDWEITWNLSPPLDVISNPNLLTANQSSMETDYTGWEKDTGLGFIVGVASGSVPFVGSQCLEVKSYLDFSPPAEYVTTPYTTAPVTVGQTYRASAYVRSFWASMVGFVSVDFLNSAGGVISTSATGSGDATVTTEWVHCVIEGAAPSGTAYARVRMRMVEVGALDRPMYLDAVELRHVGA